MSKPYLEMTYRGGKPFAAYLYISRQPGDSVAKTQKHGSVLVDISQDGRIMGIEIPDPSTTRINDLLKTLETYHITDVSSDELAPLAA